MVEKITSALIFILILFLTTSSANAEEPLTVLPQKTNHFTSPLKNSEIDFFPIPIFETRPDEGQSYGLMPVVLFTDKDSKAIKLILASIGQYNNIIKWSGAAVAYWYPNPNKNPDEVFEFYFEYAQKYYRETTLRYFNPKLGDHFYLHSKFLWLKTPFRRFYGYGAATSKADMSNFVSRNFNFDTTLGYYLARSFRINITESFASTDLLTRAFVNTKDTLATYGALPGVVDATNFIHNISLTYDTRKEGLNSKKGTFLEGRYFFALKGLLSDQTFQGASVEAIHLIPFLEEKTITALRLFVQDMYGTGIPFYQQSSLGGPFEHRAFIPNRFTDTGKMIFTWEQRIRFLKKNLFGIPVELYADPFVEIGRVFNHLNNLGFKNVQPVGGLGLRAVVPPNVVGRLDIAVGKEGYSVYTMLGYPF